MDAIKKKMQAMKLEKDNAQDKADTCEGQAKDANLRADKVNEDVRDLVKKLAQVEGDLVATKNNLEQANKDLEEKEKSPPELCDRVFFKRLQAESEMAAQNRKVQLIEEDLERSEERSNTALTKLAEASEAAEEAKR
uniref:Tropomyosin n=1 Tax=Timema douglasi TaxID=61478 RepID=A0A7R8Z2Y2_TIMDO|nr:unnamed protein product [Timema douglasi]